MPKYTDEIREKALALMEEKGVKAASEELKINTMTLYKWKKGIKEDFSSKKSDAISEAENF